MINIGIIGLGIMGKNHYRVLKTIEGVNVACLCDPNAEDTFDEKLYRNEDEMLASEKLDAVLIAVPTFLHKEVTIKCINKGLDVFIEKPVASKVDDGYDILKAAKKANVKAVVGHIERFNPVVNALKNELKDKEIYSVSITRVGPFPPRIGDVGVLTDLSVHDIDLIRYITEKEIIESNIFKSQKIHNHFEDNAILSFNLENDIVASIMTNWLTPFKKRTIEVACKEAYYVADLMSQDLQEYSSFKINNSYVVRGCFVRKGEPLFHELNAFINLVRDDKNSNMASIEDSIKTLELLESK